MGAKEHQSVTESMRLPDGVLWPIPVCLGIPAGLRLDEGRVLLRGAGGELLGVLEAQEVFERDRDAEAELVYGTTEPAHPGVARVLGAPALAVAGPIQAVVEPLPGPVGARALTPTETRAAFAAAAAALPRPAAAVVSASPDPTWQTNGRVEAVAYLGNTVYVGGSFTAVRDPAGGSVQARSRLAAFNASSPHQLLPWNPGANNTVRALAVSPAGTRVYAGGAFTAAGGATRYRVAALDPTSGGALNWAPYVNDDVKAVTTSNSGAHVYLGGDFTSVEGPAGGTWPTSGPAAARCRPRSGRTWAAPASRPCWPWTSPPTATPCTSAASSASRGSRGATPARCPR
jgi:PUA-like domain